MPFDNGGSYGLESEDFAAFEVGLQQMLITPNCVSWSGASSGVCSKNRISAHPDVSMPALRPESGS
jgi:hypothetical protein